MKVKGTTVDQVQRRDGWAEHAPLRGAQDAPLPAALHDRALLPGRAEGVPQRRAQPGHSDIFGTLGSVAFLSSGVSSARCIFGH